MTEKKKLITTMARLAAVVLALALAVVLLASIIEHSQLEEWRRAQLNQRTEAFEQARLYLDELAQRVNATPVDPTLVSEIESDYFERYDNGPMAVWAISTDGAFLFGVPRESFSRMNAIYDREITPRLREGVFYDRQSFILGHLDEDGSTLLLRDLAGVADETEIEEQLWEQLSHSDQLSEDGFVLSAPVATDSGAALGSLYLKQSAPPRNYFRTDPRTDAALAISTAAAGLSFLFLWILLPTWVYVDARERNVPRAPLFAFLTVVSSVVGLVVYLISRPENRQRLSCPGCAEEVDAGAYCPHCGNDLAAAFCQTCSYPLSSDWSFCPSCRTELSPVEPDRGRHGDGHGSEPRGSGPEGPVPELG